MKVRNQHNAPAAGAAVLLLQADQTNDANMALIKADSAAGTRLLVRANGRVGMGTLEPTMKLHLYGSDITDASAIKIQGTGGTQGYPLVIGRGGLFKSDDVLWLRTETSHDVIIGTGGVEKVRITAGGNLGIGTPTPTEKLEVNGNVKVSGKVNVSGRDAIDSQGYCLYG